MGPAQPLVGAIVGHTHAAPTGNERQLVVLLSLVGATVVLLSHWTMQQWAPPTATNC